MKNTIKQIFHSGKFVTGFVIFLAILLTIIIYPLVVAKDPLAMIGNGNFFKPGTYLSIQDTVNSGKTYKMNVDATASIVESKLTMDNRSMMAEWLEKYGGVDASEIDVTDAEGLIALWEEKYDPNAEQKGLIAAKKKKYQRLDNEIDGILEDVPTIIAEKNEETGELEEVQSIDSKQYINEKDENWSGCGNHCNCDRTVPRTSCRLPWRFCGQPDSVLYQLVHRYPILRSPDPHLLQRR